jgi:hypothetical protein
MLMISARQTRSTLTTHEIIIVTLRSYTMDDLQRLPVFASAQSDHGMFLSAVIRLHLFLQVLRLV